MNTSLLRAVLAERGITQRELAKMVGMSANSMNRKITGKREFTVSEADKISTVLKIETPGKIFLPDSSQTRNERDD